MRISEKRVVFHINPYPYVIANITILSIPDSIERSYMLKNHSSPKRHLFDKIILIRSNGRKSLDFEIIRKIINQRVIQQIADNN